MPKTIKLCTNYLYKIAITETVLLCIRHTVCVCVCGNRYTHGSVCDPGFHALRIRQIESATFGPQLSHQVS